MNRVVVHQQFHGYRSGHQLLSASIALDAKDQDAVDQLSDLAGSVRPGEVFNPYLSAYPVPSGSFYILAKTFPDLGARRSGCVRTRSVLVPMDSWETVKSLHDLFSVLSVFDLGTKAEPQEVSIDGPRPTKVVDARSGALVAALFAMEREPVVFFDAAQPEAIAARLLLALWPAIRRRFALCTFALGPRKIDDRYFDLVFAPASAHARFVGHPLRRIGARNATARDREQGWADPTARRIFEYDEPSLTVESLLEGPNAGEEDTWGMVRVALLWNELVDRAAKKPTAVLGMLDILNSRVRRPDKVWSSVIPKVHAAIDLAIAGLSPNVALEFLFALEGKLEENGTTEEVSEHIESAASSLGRRSSTEVLQTLQQDPATMRAGRRALKGLADGVAQSKDFGDLFGVCAGLPPSVLLTMVEQCAHFAGRMLAMVAKRPEDWFGALLRIFETPEGVAKQFVRRSFVMSVDDCVMRKTVPVMLEGASDSELEEIAVQAIRRDEFESSELGDLLVDIASERGSLEGVRDAVAREVEDNVAEQFLLATLKLTNPCIDWLWGRVDDTERASRLMRALLESANDDEIRMLAEARDAIQKALSVLAIDLRGGSRQIARILTLNVVSGEPAMVIGLRALRMLWPDEALDLGKWILCEGLTRGVLDEARLHQTLAEYGAKLDAEKLIRVAVSGEQKAERIAPNLIALDSAPPRVRDGVVEKIVVLSAYLVKLRWIDLGEVAYAAWAAMLRDAIVNHEDESIGAAGIVLGYALGSVRFPVSKLVVEAFPLVYKRLPRLKDAIKGNQLPGTRVISPFWFFGRPDAKTGRQNLINDLVSAFMRSSWPAVDLGAAAVKAGVERKVVRRIRRRLFGSRYIEQIKQEAESLPGPAKKRLMKCLLDAN